jgi:probable F420-dependent oxidoreductase
VAVQLAIGITHLDHVVGSGPGALLEVARTVDELGFAQLVLSEHVVMGRATPGHPGSTAAFPFDATEPYPDPLVLLGAIAAATRRVVLSTGIVIAPLRPAVLLAKLAATVDWLTGGRFELGIGSGWHDAEFEALGVPLDQRVPRLDDTLQVCRHLWTGEPAAYSSPYTTFGEITFRPLPVQERLPIWVAGAANKAMAGRVARWGDGWSAIGSTGRDELAAGTDLLRRAYEDAGRDPATVRVRATPVLPRTLEPAERLDAWIASVPDLEEAGATVVQLPLPAMVRERADIDRVLARVADSFTRGR